MPQQPACTDRRHALSSSPALSGALKYRGAVSHLRAMDSLPPPNFVWVTTDDPVQCPSSHYKYNDEFLVLIAPKLVAAEFGQWHFQYQRVPRDHGERPYRPSVTALGRRAPLRSRRWSLTDPKTRTRSGRARMQRVPVWAAGEGLSPWGTLSAHCHDRTPTSSGKPTSTRTVDRVPSGVQQETYPRPPQLRQHQQPPRRGAAVPYSRHLPPVPRYPTVLLPTPVPLHPSDTHPVSPGDVHLEYTPTGRQVRPGDHVRIGPVADLVDTPPWGSQTST